MSRSVPHRVVSRTVRGKKSFLEVPFSRLVTSRLSTYHLMADTQHTLSMPCIHVAVGSTNPCKLDAVRQAFQEAFSVDIIVMGYDVESGVSNQPFGDFETKLGAKNRAQAAYEASTSTTPTQCAIPDFAVGLEGGLILEEQPRQLWCMAWMAILRIQKTDDQLSWGFAKTASFILPHDFTRLVLDEKLELGLADDQVFSRTNSKHRGGTVGILTHERINRTQYYAHAIHLALIPFLSPHLY